MDLTQTKCPNCGASAFEEKSNALTCTYCCSQFAATSDNSKASANKSANSKNQDEFFNRLKAEGDEDAIEFFKNPEGFIQSFKGNNVTVTTTTRNFSSSDNADETIDKVSDILKQSGLGDFANLIKKGKKGR